MVPLSDRERKRDIAQENVYFSHYSETEDVPKCPTHPFPPLTSRVQSVRVSERVYVRESRRTEGNYIYPDNFGKLHYSFVLSKD